MGANGREKGERERKVFQYVLTRHLDRCATVAAAVVAATAAAAGVAAKANRFIHRSDPLNDIRKQQS